MNCRFSYYGLLLATVALASLPGAAFGQSNGSIQAAGSTAEDDALSPAAAAAMRGPLPMNEAEVALKRAANRAAANSAPATGAMDPRATEESGVGGPAVTLRPTVVDDHAFDGNRTAPPTDTEPLTVTGAIGPTRYIQAANRNIRIYNRNDDELGRGSLTQLAGPDAHPQTFNPQIIWDPTTSRFYYLMNSGNRLAFGFSKNANPRSIGGDDWCKYFYVPTTGRFPDYPRLGDSRDFIIIGVNSFSDAVEPKFIGADLIAISKPLDGATCPAPATFKTSQRLALRDAEGDRVFTPVPANQIDSSATGFVVARNGSLPSNKLWFFSVTRGAGDIPVIDPTPHRLTLPKEYTLPSDAAQPDTSRRLETLDARPTQAVQARNPFRNRFSFWVQHTVKLEDGGRSVVRWYEINPAVNPPVLLRSGEIGTRSSGDYFFNAAISPDRRVDPQQGVSQFGGSFVIQYNVSSGENDIAPRIVAGSSSAGAPLNFRLMKGGNEAYVDASCPDSTFVCRWSSYAGAAPDPRPITTDRGMVWGTNQYANEKASRGAFRTWIFGVQP